MNVPSGSRKCNSPRSYRGDVSGKGRYAHLNETGSVMLMRFCAFRFHHCLPCPVFWPAVSIDWELARCLWMMTTLSDTHTPLPHLPACPTPPPYPKTSFFHLTLIDSAGKQEKSRGSQIIRRGRNLCVFGGVRVLCVWCVCVCVLCGFMWFMRTQICIMTWVWQRYYNLKVVYEDTAYVPVIQKA